MCLSCICLLAMHTLICVTFSIPPSVGGWLRVLLVALPGLFCLPFSTCIYLEIYNIIVASNARYFCQILTDCFCPYLLLLALQTCVGVAK